MKYTKLTDKELEIILSGKYSNAELSKAFNRTTSHIAYICKIYSVQLPNHRNLPSKTVNHSFFKSLTKESAYVLGFIAADGCIYRKNENSCVLEIVLAEKDVNFIEKLKNLIAPNNNIIFRPSNNSVGICIYSTQIYNDLLNLGITERKSLTLKWPEVIPADLLSHYVRGYFDGDGSVHIRTSRTGRKHLAVSIMGTYDFLNGISNVAPLGKSGIYKHKNVFDMKFMRKDNSKAFLDWIYTDCEDLYLNRKYELYANNIHLNEYD